MNEKYETIIEWLLGESTGESAKTICRHMLGMPHKRISYPHDAGDRGRCIRLLNLIPEWWDRLDEMAELPSSEVAVYENGKHGIKLMGWKQEIPLIKKEANRE